MATSVGSWAAWQAYLDEDYTWFPYRSGIVLIVLCTIAYALRFWARRYQTAPWGWDDWLMIPSYIFVVATCVSGILCAEYGSGRHIEWVIINTPSGLTNWGIMNLYVIAFVYVLAVTLPKLALLVLYLRIFTDRFSRWCCWITMFLICARVVIDFVTIPIQCGSHPEYAWQPSYWAGNCNNIIMHYTLVRIANILSDVVCLLLPMPTIWKLHLPLHVKLGILAPFLLGSFGLAAAIITMVAFVEGNILADGTWVTGDLIAWTVIEPSVYFISVCLVTYRSLLTHLIEFCGFRPTEKRDASPSRHTDGPSRDEKHGSLSSGPMAVSPASSETRSPEPNHPVTPAGPLDWIDLRPQAETTTLPPAPLSLPASVIGRKALPTASKRHRLEPDECGECYDCLAGDISRSMDRARSADLMV